MDKRGGLQGMSDAFPSQISMSLPPQFSVDQIQKFRVRDAD